MDDEEGKRLRWMERRCNQEIVQSVLVLLAKLTFTTIAHMVMPSMSDGQPTSY